jgi:hypothetical protein
LGGNRWDSSPCRLPRASKRGNEMVRPSSRMTARLAGNGKSETEPKTLPSSL